MNPNAIGVDIGGSHIACAAIDLSTHRIIPGTGSAQKIYNKARSGEILDGWSNAIAGTMAVIDKKSLAGIGFAMPGPFGYPKGIALFERVEKYERRLLHKMPLFPKSSFPSLKKMLPLSVGPA